MSSVGDGVVSTGSTDGEGSTDGQGSTDGRGSTDSTGGEVPFLRVVKGEPTPDELAALVVVLASLGGRGARPPRRTPLWNAPRRLHRQVHAHGPDGWRASGLPR